MKNQRQSQSTGLSVGERPSANQNSSSLSMAPTASSSRRHTSRVYLGPMMMRWRSGASSASVSAATMASRVLPSPIWSAHRPPPCATRNAAACTWWSYRGCSGCQSVLNARMFEYCTLCCTCARRARQSSVSHTLRGTMTWSACTSTPGKSSRRMMTSTTFSGTASSSNQRTCAHPFLG
jgi:hypothetical protein